MPVKDGDKVYFKIASGAIKMGKYDAKTKMVMMSGGKKAKPPKKALHHTRKGAMDGAFVKLKGSSDVLGAPKKYSSKNAKEKPTPTKKVRTKKTSMYKLSGKIYKKGKYTFEDRTITSFKGFRALPKSQFKRSDSDVESGQGDAIANMTDTGEREYREEHLAAGSTLKKLTAEEEKFYKTRLEKLPKTKAPVDVPHPDELFGDLNNYDKALKEVKELGKKREIDTHMRIDIVKKGSKLRRTFLWDGKNIYRQGLFGKEGNILGKMKNMKFLRGWYEGRYNKYNIPDVFLKDENKNLQEGLTLNKEGVSRLR